MGSDLNQNMEGSNFKQRQTFEDENKLNGAPAHCEYYHYNANLKLQTNKDKGFNEMNKDYKIYAFNYKDVK
jgi:hypothetical protein